MQDSKDLINQVAGQLKKQASNHVSSAAPGRSQQGNRTPPSDTKIDAINQIFTLFRVNYHNQYYKAFSDTETLITAKRLWMESLGYFDTEALLRGAKRAIETSEYLPTLKKMIDCCQGDLNHHGLPSAHNAYIEACRAPSPKSSYNWSHSAVYHAGKISDWHFIGNNIQRIAFPIFERNYQQLCERIINGEKLPPPEVKALPETIETPLSGKENHQRMAELRKSMGL